MSGEKIKRQGVVKYVGRVQEHSRKQRRHSSFYLGLHGLSWVESLQFFEGETRQLSRLTPHKERYYRRGRQAARLIRHTL